jgi:hypothetical protein
MHRKRLMMRAILIAQKRIWRAAKRDRPAACAALLTPYPGKGLSIFGDEPIDPRGDNGQRYRAELEHGVMESAEPDSSNARSALHPKLRQSPMIHHKRLMIDQFASSTVPRGTPSRLTQPPLHRFAKAMYRKPLTMDQNLLPEL